MKRWEAQLAMLFIIAIYSHVRPEYDGWFQIYMFCGDLLFSGILLFRAAYFIRKGE